MTNPALLIAFGIFVGVFSGLMGLGGGAVMIPIMVLAFGFEQAKAHGMSLMVMIPPVALPAVIKYFREGHLRVDQGDIWTAAFISAGLLAGSYFGASIATTLAKHKGMLAAVFGLLLVYVAVYTALGKGNIGRSVVLSLLVTIVAAGVVLGAKWYDAQKSGTQMATDKG
jgi:uncharacterized protein